MARIALILPLMAALAAPAAAPAQQAAPDENGGALIGEGARRLLEGLLREIEPAMKDLEDIAGEAGPALRDFLREMGPALAGILGRIDDLSNYQMPEMLPNGDIIIRRKTPLAPEAEPRGEVEI